jgi:hypothetical protein
MKLSQRLCLSAIALGLLAAALLGPRPVRADFDWSPLIVQWENRTPNISGAGYPPGAIPIQGGSADVAASSAVATLAAATGKTTWITHFRCTGTGSTTAVGADITVAGPTNSEIYIMGFASGATVANVPVDVTYSPPQPAAAANTAITVTMATGGTGNLHAACAAEGFQTALAP